MSLKEDYKNEILPEGMEHRTYNVIGADGAIVHQNIHLEKSYVPQQVGDNFGAQQINEIAHTVNSMSEGGTFNLPAAGWGADKTQTVVVGDTPSENFSPILDVLPLTEEDNMEWGKIWKAESTNDGIKFYATDIPTKDLTVKYKGVV